MSPACNVPLQVLPKDKANCEITAGPLIWSMVLPSQMLPLPTSRGQAKSQVSFRLDKTHVVVVVAVVEIVLVEEVVVDVVVVVVEVVDVVMVVVELVVEVVVEGGVVLVEVEVGHCQPIPDHHQPPQLSPPATTVVLAVLVVVVLVVTLKLLCRGILGGRGEGSYLLLRDRLLEESSKSPRSWQLHCANHWWSTSPPVKIGAVQRGRSSRKRVRRPQQRGRAFL